MFIVFPIVLSLCAVKLRMLFHVVDLKKNVTLSTVLVSAVFFILLETKHSVLRSARVCTGTGTL
jgi:hypothetical protein